MHVAFAKDPARLERTLFTVSKELQGQHAIANKYARALAYNASENPEHGLKLIREIQQDDTQRLIYTVSEAEMLLKLERQQDALKLLKKALSLNPSNYALTLAYSHALHKTGGERNREKAITLLQNLSHQRPEDPIIWQQLTRLYGDNEDPISVHRARAEYLYLHAAYDRAVEQLKFASKKSKGNHLLRAKIKHRATEMRAHQNDLRI